MPPIPIKLVGAAQGFNWLPVFVAIEQGFFRQANLDVELAKVGGVEKATRAVLLGEADIAITPPEGAVTNHVAGGELCIFAANSVRLPMSLVARREIKRISDLRGKKIGTSSLTEGTAIYTQVMLAERGLHYPGDYEFALAGIHTARWDALQNGLIDAAPQPAPWNFLAADRGYTLLGEVCEAIPEILFGALIANKPWLDQNVATVSSCLQALDRAHSYVNDSRNESSCGAIFQKITISDDTTLAARGFTYMRDMGMWPNRLAISPNALETTLQMMIRAQLLTSAQISEARSVFDSRYLKDALQ